MLLHRSIVTSTNECSFSHCCLRAGIGTSCSYTGSSVNRRAAASPHIAVYLQVYTPDKLNQLMADSDYVVAALPYTDKTDKFINAEAIGSMRSRGVFINVGRGKTGRRGGTHPRSEAVAGFLCLSIRWPQPLLHSGCAEQHLQRVADWICLSASGTSASAAVHGITVLQMQPGHTPAAVHTLHGMSDAADDVCLSPGPALTRFHFLLQPCSRTTSGAQAWMWLQQSLCQLRAPCGNWTTCSSVLTLLTEQ